VDDPVGLLQRSLAQLQLELRSGQIRAADLVAAGRERMARHGGPLGAYIARDEALLEAQARAADAALAAGADTGPLQGIPISVKDLYGVHGLAVHAGSPRRLPPAWEREGPLLGALRRQLALVTGKTHTVEFAFGGLGTNPHWPTPRNPWDAQVHRVPGGSSAGAGVSLHCDALLALGTDTAGSVRIPAAMTGAVGVKTTRGRWSTDGIVPLSPSFDSPGLLARSVADARLAFHALDAQPAPPAPPVRALRLGVCEAPFWDECSAGVAKAVQRALDELAGAGAELVPLPLAEVDETLAIFRAGHLAAVELYEFLHAELGEWMATLDPVVAARMADAGELAAHEYLRRRRRLGTLAAGAARRLRAVDAIAAPTVPITAPPLAEVQDAQAYRRCNLLALRNTSVANLLGLCAVTVPVGLDAAGIPVGLQLCARGGHDAALLALAESCERVWGSAFERLGPAPLAPV